jgi:hypothetical protein
MPAFSIATMICGTSLFTVTNLKDAEGVDFLFANRNLKTIT